MNKKRFVIVATTTVLICVLWIILTPLLVPDTQAEDDTTAPYPGFRAPIFSLQTPLDETVSLADYQGQPVLVFLWASWCSVCKAIMPGLQLVYEDYAPKGFTILAVNAADQDSLPAAVNYFQTQGYTYTLLLDEDGSVARDYKLHALPTSILVGPDGRVLDVIIGSGMSAGYLRSRLEDILTREE